MHSFATKHAEVGQVSNLRAGLQPALFRFANLRKAGSKPASRMQSCPTLLALLMLTACGGKQSSMEDLTTRDITLPGGQVLRVETAVDARDMLRGLMFRTSLAPDRGMLFVHPHPGNYGYWMYETYIPLDIIVLDSGQSIIAIVPNAPPCKTQASKCPHYGENVTGQYALELAGGMAQKYGLHVGDRINF